MSRVKLYRDRGGSILKEEVVDENLNAVVERFLTGISISFSNNATHAQLRSVVESLNALVKNITFSRATDQPSFQPDQRVLQGLHLGLMSSSLSFRTACARTLRYTVTSVREFSVLLRLNTNVLISRCVDTVSQTNTDYFQIIRLVSSLYRLAVRQCPSRDVTDFFGVIISSCCSAILYESTQQNQKSQHKQQISVPRKLTAEIISEACLSASLPSDVPSPQMLHSLLAVALSESFYLSVNEAIVGVFVHLLNYPHTRRALFTSGCLETLIAKFSDDTVSVEVTSPMANDDPNKAPAFQWRAAQFVLAKIFHSCPGAFALLGGSYCRELLNGLAPPMAFEPDVNNGFVSSRISQKRIKRQRELLGLLATIFNIEIPMSTTDITSAILSTDPRKFDESWAVSENFIAAEAEDLLHLSFSSRYFNTIFSAAKPDPVSTLIALLLSAFIEAHLASALVTFSMSCFQYSLRGCRPSQKGGVIQSDPHLTDVECLGVQAAVILAHVLYQAKRLLVNNTAALDEIEQCIAAFHYDSVHPERQDVVQTIFDIIDQTSTFLASAENKPSSLHLEVLLRYCPKPPPPSTTSSSNSSHSVEARPRSQSSSFARQLLESTGLLTTTPTMEAITWPSIRLLLSLPQNEVRRSVSESDLITAFRNLAAFYKSSNSFCHTDISTAIRTRGRTNAPQSKTKNRLPDIVHSAISLIDFLLAIEPASSPDSVTAPSSLSVTTVGRADYYKIAGDLINDICRTLNNIATNSQCSVGEPGGTGYISLGSLPRVGAQFWFAILGACTSGKYREALLEDHRSSAFDVLQKLIGNSQSTEVMRLALSFLNFSASEKSRQLLLQAFKNTELEVRLYAVKLVTGLWLRIDDPFSFAKWAVPIIAPLIADEQWQVADSTVMALLDALPRCPFAASVIQSLNPPFRLKETAHRLLYGCCLCAPGSWQVPNAGENVAKELEFWITEGFHASYSQYCDEMFVESLSCCFSRQPNSTEHYSNARGNRRIRIPGRDFPPSIFSCMARNQLGLHILNMKTIDFVRRCCDVVTHYADVKGDSLPNYNNEVVTSIRASICILANISSTPLGADWLASNPNFEGFNIISTFHALARLSPVFSVRGTALIGLSVAATCVDPDMLVDCEWVDRRRRSNLTRYGSSTLSLPRDDNAQEGSGGRRLTFSVPDISVDSPSTSLYKRRASTNDLPPVSFGVSRFSSSSTSSAESGDSNVPAATVAAPAAPHVSLPVTPNLTHRPSLPVIHRGTSFATEPDSSKRTQPRRQLSSISSRIVSLWKGKSSRSKNVSATYDQTEDAFYPDGGRTSTDSAHSSAGYQIAESLPVLPQRREKSFSIEISEAGHYSNGNNAASFKASEFAVGSTDDSPRSFVAGDSPRSIQDIDARSTTRSVSIRHPSGDSNVRSLFQPFWESSDSGACSSTFYLPMEELSNDGRSSATVFLPKNVSDLLQDTVTNVPGFRPSISGSSPMPRKQSMASAIASTSKQATEAQQLFPPGQASDMIKEHTKAHCLICCITDQPSNVIEKVTDEWQQVLWLVVSLQIWPNRTPKMLLSYFANNRRLASNGCLYSEVVSLMSRIALPRLSRSFVHSLFDTLSFPQLVTAAKELNPSVV